METRESPESTDNNGLIETIERMVMEQRAYGRVIVNEGGKSLTISIEAQDTNTSGEIKEGKLLIDQEIVDAIASITGSDEISRIFVGSHPFWATITTTRTGRTSIRITSPSVNPMEKIAPCCLCKTVEDKLKRVKEDRKTPIPADKVETGEPAKEGVSTAQRSPGNDFIGRFIKETSAKSASAVAETKGRLGGEREKEKEQINTNIVNAVGEIIRHGGKTKPEKATIRGMKIAYFVQRDANLHKNVLEWGKKAMQEAAKKGQDETARIIKGCLNSNGNWQIFNINLETAKATLEKIGGNPAQLGQSRQQQKLFLAFGGSVTGNGTGFWIAIE